MELSPPQVFQGLHNFVKVVGGARQELINLLNICPSVFLWFVEFSPNGEVTNVYDFKAVTGAFRLYVVKLLLLFTGLIFLKGRLLRVPLVPPLFKN